MLGKTPVFIKGHVQLAVGGEVFEFLHQNISEFGVSGLPCAPRMRDLFGLSLSVFLKIPTPMGVRTFHTQARVLREWTAVSENIELQFEFPDSDPQKNDLRSCIRANGFCPSAYIRKYPRIPSLEVIQTFPLQVLVTPIDQKMHYSGSPLGMKVLNLSPNGALIQTENSLAFSLRPMDRLQLVLEPRGWFPIPITMEGMICRISETFNDKTQQVARAFGIKFTKISEANKVAFLDLLKDILEQVSHINEE